MQCFSQSWSFWGDAYSLKHWNLQMSLNKLLHVPSTTRYPEKMMFQMSFHPPGVFFSKFCIFSRAVTIVIEHLCRALLTGSRSRRDFHTPADPQWICAHTYPQWICAHTRQACYTESWFQEISHLKIVCSLLLSTHVVSSVLLECRWIG